MPSSMAAFVRFTRLAALNQNDCLFLGNASSLDAFSSYRPGRGCSALPCQTTDTLVAPIHRSSRT